MAEITPEHDLILSIHPQHVANIVSRAKNHEFRNYLLPPTVQRLWIYETSPTSSIRYVATVSHGKRPGEIREPKGLRNAEFDRGDLQGHAKYAYEILKLEELPRPYPLATLKANGWLRGAPQKYCFVREPMAAALRAASLRLVFDSNSPSTVPEASAGSAEAEVEAALNATSRSRARDGLSTATGWGVEVWIDAGSSTSIGLAILSVLRGQEGAQQRPPSGVYEKQGDATGLEDDGGTM